MNYWTSARDLFLTLPKSFQWIIIVICKSVTASVLMSFLGIYATAIFATRHGFRVPVEGVLFLTFAIAFVTFIVFILTIIMFSIMMLLFLYIKTYLEMPRETFISVMSAHPTPMIDERFSGLIYDHVIVNARVIFIKGLSHKIVLYLVAILLLVAISILLNTDMLDVIFSWLPSKIGPFHMIMLLFGGSIILISSWCVVNPEYA